MLFSWLGRGIFGLLCIALLLATAVAAPGADLPTSKKGWFALAAIIGGGSSLVRPGAISQAHHGVLFLDEAPEFRIGALQALRQPLESGEVVVARARAAVRFPARFQLVMAANPCPCGQGFGKGAECHCSPLAKRAYLGKLSGPLLDRVDLPRIPIPHDQLTWGGVLAGVIALLGTLLAAVAGGKVGRHYHDRVDTYAGR